MTTNGIDDKALVEKMRASFPKPPVFKDMLQKREWCKFRLAQAFRIFGQYRFLTISWYSYCPQVIVAWIRE
jgi:hypothetical protein